MTFELSWYHVIQPAILIIVSLVGWGVKALRADSAETKKMIRDLNQKIDGVRLELHGELQHYIPKTFCDERHHVLEEKVDILSKKLDIRLQSYINDVALMRLLHDNMTPEERHIHAAKCQFKEDR